MESSSAARAWQWRARRGVYPAGGSVTVARTAITARMRGSAVSSSSLNHVYLTLL